MQLCRSNIAGPRCVRYRTDFVLRELQKRYRARPLVAMRSIGADRLLTHSEPRPSSYVAKIQLKHRRTKLVLAS
jgi:hypothetical protein